MVSVSEGLSVEVEPESQANDPGLAEWIWPSSHRYMQISEIAPVLVVVMKCFHEKIWCLA